MNPADFALLMAPVAALMMVVGHFWLVPLADRLIERLSRRSS